MLSLPPQSYRLPLWLQASNSICRLPLLHQPRLRLLPHESTQPPPMRRPILPLIDTPAASVLLLHSLFFFHFFFFGVFATCLVLGAWCLGGEKMWESKGNIYIYIYILILVCFLIIYMILSFFLFAWCKLFWPDFSTSDSLYRTNHFLA